MDMIVYNFERDEVVYIQGEKCHKWTDANLEGKKKLLLDLGGVKKMSHEDWHSLAVSILDSEFNRRRLLEYAESQEAEERAEAEAKERE